MKWFKMLWLNSEEREILRNAGKQISEPLKREDIVSAVNTAVEGARNILSGENLTGRPYKNIFYSNKNLTVIFWDGTMVSKSEVSQPLFLAVKNAQSQKEVEDLLIDKVVAVIVDEKIETKAERELISSNLDIFLGKPDFVVNGSNVNLKGVNLAMPAPVIASFIELLEKARGAMNSGMNRNVVESYEEQVDALKMFWLKLALNTLPQSREDLLVFVRKNDVRITRNGNLILYRRIVSKIGADTQLVTFVTQEYYKCKKQGGDPRQWGIAKVGDDYVTVDLLVFDPTIQSGSTPIPFCNLQQMYLELPTYDTNSFTAAHDNKVNIKLGAIYSIPENKINLNNGLCAAGGLHAAAVDYNYSGFGDLPVVVLVNPSKAITVPRNETGKLRTTEMFVACVNDKPQGTHFDESALSAFDSEYHDFTLSELEEAAKNKSFEKLSVLDNVPAVSLVDLNQIKDMLRNRVKQVI